MRSRGWRAAFLLTAALSLVACRGSLGACEDECPGDPDAQVMALRCAWEAVPCGAGLYHDPCPAPESAEAARSKELIRRQAENLLYRYPQHAPTLMFAGLLAYEADDRRSAEQLLDDALRVRPAYPEAAALRARIALEDGNVPFARALLEEQVALIPDNSTLYEVLSSTYFLDEDYGRAWVALDVAERLGAPRWRVLYNRALIEESRGNTQQAAGLYRESRKLAPGWPLPSGRLRALDQG